MLKVTKTVVEQFYLKKEPWWAAIFIDSDKLMLSIQSDYGDYSYRWTSVGKSFKEFLLKIDDNYFMDKLSGGKTEFDFDKTRKSIKLDIIRYRKSSDIDEETAREAWDDLNNFEAAFPNEFYSELPESIVEGIYNNEDPAIPCEFVTPYRLQAFVKEIWSEFKPILKKDIENAIS